MGNVPLITGDIFQSKMQTWVNPINCCGSMGSGLAWTFRRYFGDMYWDYKGRCARKEVAVGEPYLYRRVVNPWVLNFPTKYHWLNGSSLTCIAHGLCHLELNYKDWGIESLAVPALGCGLGGLDWMDVKPLLVRSLSKLEIPVELYEPMD